MGLHDQLPTEVAMNVMYNSENYYVVEFPGRHGIELVDKTTGRAGFLDGAVEVKFRATMADLAAGEPSVESVDEFLAHYDALLINSVAVH
jgi:ABC-type ATPase with predicted acetyltransferase domain